MIWTLIATSAVKIIASGLSILGNQGRRRGVDAMKYYKGGGLIQKRDVHGSSPLRGDDRDQKTPRPEISSSSDQDTLGAWSRNLAFEDRVRFLSSQGCEFHCD